MVVTVCWGYLCEGRLVDVIDVIFCCGYLCEGRMFAGVNFLN